MQHEQTPTLAGRFLRELALRAEFGMPSGARSRRSLINAASATAFDQRYMLAALAEARRASAADEVPVGAVVYETTTGVEVARAHNLREANHDPTAHAELLALRAAAARRGSWRLDDCTLVVTLEPCAMCAGALVLARIGKVVFGATDPKAGFAGSLGNILHDPRLNHHPETIAGVCAEECAAILRDFFALKRSRQHRS